MSKVKLTSAKQKKVIRDLQNGYILITDSTFKGAIVGTTKDEYHISNTVFWNLVDKGLIYQQISGIFNFVLTDLGRNIKI